MIFITRLFILMTFMALASCSTVSSPIKNRDKQYLTATSIPPLKIPPGLSSTAFENDYPVSNQDYPKNIQYVSLKPPGL